MSVVAQQVRLRELTDHPFELLRELERRSRAAAAGAHGDDIDVEEWVGIGFRLATDSFVVARDEVREVLMMPPTITRVPGAKTWIRGLANVRGHLLPISDLREFLGAGAGGDDRTGRVLVANSTEYPVGLVVDEVFGFRRFVEREHGSDPHGGVVRCDRFITGSFQRGEEIWPVFSLNRLLDTPEFQQASAE